MIERYKLTGKVKKRLNISDIQSIEIFCTPFAPPLINRQTADVAERGRYNPPAI